MSVKKSNDCVVYFHRNPITNIIFYVGIGQLKRAYNLSKKSRCVFWGRYVNKYGKPIVDIVHDGISDAEAAALEIKYIKQLGRRNYDRNGTLVNRSSGGEQSSKGMKHTKHARMKITEALLKRPPLTSDQRRKRSEARKGVKLSPEWCEKIRLSKRGSKHPFYGKERSEETKQKIGQSNFGKVGEFNGKSKKVINTITKEIFPSALQVSKKFFKDEHPFTLISRLNGRRSNYTDFQYLQDYKDGVKKYINANDDNKPIKVKNILTGKEYLSISEAARDNGVTDGAVHFHLKGKLKKSKPEYCYI